VPLVTALLEPPTRYCLPAEPGAPPPATLSETKGVPRRAQRGPSLKSLVKLAMKADSAEALGLLVSELSSSFRAVPISRPLSSPRSVGKFSTLTRKD
jgi:hypothetical protein